MFRLLIFGFQFTFIGPTGDVLSCVRVTFLDNCILARVLEITRGFDAVKKCHASEKKVTHLRTVIVTAYVLTQFLTGNVWFSVALGYKPVLKC